MKKNHKIVDMFYLKKKSPSPKSGCYTKIYVIDLFVRNDDDDNDDDSKSWKQKN